MKNVNIKKVYSARPVIEGAGVNLNRVFGYYQVPELDPFLLLDDFRTNKKEDYIKGFPWHPHRGIETITYILEGKVEHGDSLGNQGIIQDGQVQWMNAGSGIIHQEMPKGNEAEIMSGFQLWLNLPSHKKMSVPAYQGIDSEQIPLIKSENGVEIKIICGEYEGVKGPVSDVAAKPVFMDVLVKKENNFNLKLKEGHKCLCYVYEGEGKFANSDNITEYDLALLEEGNEITIKTFEKDLRFLFMSGIPLNEPVAWKGPIVMNTKEEIDLAFQELKTDSFIKNKPS